MQFCIFCSDLLISASIRSRLCCFKSGIIRAGCVQQIMALPPYQTAARFVSRRHRNTTHCTHAGHTLEPHWNHTGTTMESH